MVSLITDGAPLDLQVTDVGAVGVHGLSGVRQRQLVHFRLLQLRRAGQRCNMGASIGTII